MKTAMIISAALGLLIAASPTLAQVMTPAQAIAAHERSARATAQKLGSARINPRKLSPIYQGRLQIDARHDPWIPMTNKAMNRTNTDQYTRKARYSLQVQVDFNGDGHADTAYIANNSRQAAVIVNLGGQARRSIIAYKQDGTFIAGEEIFAAGRNRILVNVPGASQHLLLMANGQPRVVNYGE